MIASSNLALTTNLITMNLFKSLRTRILKSKIKAKNLLLLNLEESNSTYILQKLYAWQEEFDYVEWNEFKTDWRYCHKCKSYSEGSCICYAR